jgi:hypothetical protein
MNNRRDHHTRDLVGLIEMLSERIAILSFRIALGVNSDPTGVAVWPPPKIRLRIPKRLSAAVEDLKGKVRALARRFPNLGSNNHRTNETLRRCSVLI